jgi:hypothetical protein
MLSDEQIRKIHDDFAHRGWKQIEVYRAIAKEAAAEEQDRCAEIVAKHKGITTGRSDILERIRAIDKDPTP